MSIKFTILGCGYSMGVPRIDGNFGKCNPSNFKNYRTRCSALISYSKSNILILEYFFTNLWFTLFSPIISSITKI